jgi:hypothetical protein
MKKKKQQNNGKTQMTIIMIRVMIMIVLNNKNKPRPLHCYISTIEDSIDTLPDECTLTSQPCPIGDWARE